MAENITKPLLEGKPANIELETPSQISTNKSNLNDNSVGKATQATSVGIPTKASTSKLPTEPASKNTSNFNSRLLWPDLIKIPNNKWVYECNEIIDKLGTDNQVLEETKKNLEKCLLYFYTLKKRLDLFDHTYTASCILLFRFWFIHGIPNNLIDCIHIAQAILVTACKTSENNRPIDAYVKATCEFISREIQGNKITNIDKMKWDIRDKLVENEKNILCMFGFDLNIENPKEILEEMFSGFYRYNRDHNIPEAFQKIVPKLLQETRNFIVQSVTQPVCLLFDGQKFVQVALIYAGAQYKKMVDKDFKYPKNFFKEKFLMPIEPDKMEDFFTDFRILEENFFALKSNKGEKLHITKKQILDLIEEDPIDLENAIDPYDYSFIRSGVVRQELLDNTETRLQDMFTKIKNEYQQKKKHSLAPENTTINKKIKM